jgi:hypothetical protein
VVKNLAKLKRSKCCRVPTRVRICFGEKTQRNVVVLSKQIFSDSQNNEANKDSLQLVLVTAISQNKEMFCFFNKLQLFAPSFS